MILVTYNSTIFIERVEVDRYGYDKSCEFFFFGAAPDSHQERS